jgi:hypothetical protein
MGVRRWPGVARQAASAYPPCSPTSPSRSWTKTRKLTGQGRRESAKIILAGRKTGSKADRQVLFSQAHRQEGSQADTWTGDQVHRNSERSYCTQVY